MAPAPNDRHCNVAAFQSNRRPVAGPLGGERAAGRSFDWQLKRRLVHANGVPHTASDAGE